MTLTWQKKVQKIIKQVGRDLGFEVENKEKEFTIKTRKGLTNWNGRREVLHYNVRPDVVFKKKGKIKYIFEIEPKEDKILIGSTINAILLSAELKCSYFVITKTEKKAILAFNLMHLVDDKVYEDPNNAITPHGWVNHYADKGEKTLYDEIMEDLEDLK